MNNPILSSQFNEAVTWFGSQIESFISEHRDEKGKPLYSLSQLLDPVGAKERRNRKRRASSGPLTAIKGARVRRRTKEDLVNRKKVPT